MGRYDKSSKWLIQHHGDSILRLGGVRNIARWRALQAEVVQPSQLPDGLLEAELVGQPDADLYLLELVTYPERRVLEQLARDTTLVWLDRRVLPEVLVVVLYPKGNLRVTESQAVQSRQGWTRLDVCWRVVELWNVPAEDLLALNDPGLAPWIPLTKFDGPPEPVLQQCRDLIEQQGPADERTNLLAVAQMLATLKYDDPRLLDLLGGKQIMIESPLIEGYVVERMIERSQEMILRFLSARFGPVPEDVSRDVRAVSSLSELDRLVELAGECSDLDTFRRHLEQS